MTAEEKWDAALLTTVRYPSTKHLFCHGGYETLAGGM
jgi:hypothetical protein